MSVDKTVPAAEMTAKQIYLRLLGYTSEHRLQLGLAVLGMVMFAAADTTFMWLMKPLLDESFVERNASSVLWLPVAVISLFLLRGAGSFLSSYFMTWVGRKIIVRLRKQIFGHMLSLPQQFYDHSTTGSLLARMTYTLEQVSQSATTAVTIVIRDTLTVIGLIGLMVWLSPKLALFTLAVGPFISVIVTYVSRRFRRYSKRIQQSMGNVTHVVSEAIEGHREVKIFGGTAYEQKRFEDVNAIDFRLHMKLSLTQSLSSPAVQFISAWALAAIIYVAASDGVAAQMSAGTFAAFMAATVGMLRPLKHLTTVSAVVQKGIAAAQDVFDLLDTQPEPDHGKHRCERVAGSLSFKDLHFAYDGDNGDVLKGIDLEVAAGETVALVGQSGSGKTTLVSLLPRFYEISRGSVELDGVALQDYHLADLRAQVALVSQQVVLFNDTIAANIAYGTLADTPRAAIIDAAKAANAWEFIEKLPQGLETRTGENGTMLSGGQRQRIAIARALLKDAPVLILDEATSALDTETERKIQDALERLMENRTTFVVAHRLSTIEKADRIVVMDSGRILETGSHAELQALDGHYARLHRLQFGSD